MIKGTRLLSNIHKQFLSTLKRPIVLYRFSNTSSKGPNNDEQPQDSESAASSSESSKPTEDSNLYYPIKRINFRSRSYFPIYKVKDNERMSLPTSVNLLTSYMWFLAYGVSYVFFLDIYNYWHILPLGYLFYRGTNRFFTDLQLSGTVVRSVFLHENGRTLIVTLPRTPVYYKYDEDIDLSAFGNYDDQIKMTVNLDQVYKVGFLENLQREVTEDENFVQIKSKKQKQLEEEIEEAISEEGIVLDENANIESNNIIILARRGNLALPLYIHLEKNVNTPYNDYLVAIAQKKKIVMRETKEDS